MNKVIRACIALAAFAAFVVLPATASAVNDPVLTHPTGTPLAVGTNITATNTAPTLMTDSGGKTLVSCDTATMTGTVTKNSGGAVEGNITAAEFKNHNSSECTGEFGATQVTPSTATNGLPWCLRSDSTLSTDRFIVRGNSCGLASRPIRFQLDVTTILGTVKCTFQRATVEGTYTTHPTDAILHVSKVEFPLTEGGGICPAAGFLDLSFTLETDNGNKEPLYIS